MRTEYTRQTRWSHQPESLQDSRQPGALYVKQLVWVACQACDLQVHAAMTTTIVAGLSCPECGARLTAPRVLGNPDVAAARLEEDELTLAETLGLETPFEPPTA